MGQYPTRSSRGEVVKSVVTAKLPSTRSG